MPGAGTYDLNTDKGEVGGSSPPRPTICFSRLPGVVPKTSTHNPAHISLHHLRTHSERRQIFPLRRPCFIAVVLRVQIERRLDLRLTQDSLNGLGFNFRLVHQPVAWAVTQVVKSKPLPVLDVRSSFLCRRSQLICDENRRGAGDT